MSGLGHSRGFGLITATSGLRPVNGHSQDRRACLKGAKGGSRRSHSIAAPDVSDELISYYHERETGEQVRSLSAHNRPSSIARLAELLCRASGRRIGAWKQSRRPRHPSVAL